MNKVEVYVPFMLELIKCDRR